MIKIIYILFTILLLSCQNSKTKNNLYINLENRDSINKYIFLETWLTTNENEKYDLNNNIFFSRNFFINKINFSKNELITFYNNEIISSDMIKGNLGGNRNFRLAILRPNKKLKLDIQILNLNEIYPKHYNYQIFFFNDTLLQKLNNYTLINSEKIKIVLDNKYTIPISISAEDLNNKEIHEIFNSNYLYFEGNK